MRGSTCTSVWGQYSWAKGCLRSRIVLLALSLVTTLKVRGSRAPGKDCSPRGVATRVMGLVCLF